MTTRRLCETLLGLMLFAAAVHYALDPDMWWHLRTGELIVESGIPRQDPFSFTVAGHEWITHEWLSQVFMWEVYRAAGWAGLILVFALLGAVAFWLVYRVCPGQPFLATIVVVLAASSSLFVFGVRPQVFNLLMTAVFIYVIERYRSGRFLERNLWCLIPLTVFWANLHSGYLIGVVLLLVHAVGEWLQLLFDPDQDSAHRGREARRFAVLSVVCFLAAVVNPNGVAMWMYPFQTLGSAAMQSSIQEWQSPNFHASGFWPFGALMTVGFLSFVFSSERPTVVDILLFLGTAAAGLMSLRHIPLFALVSAPIVSRHLLNAMPTLPRAVMSGSTPEPRYSRLALTLNWVLAFLGFAMVSTWTVTRINGNDDVIRQLYPVAAVDFLEREGLAGGRGYNSYNWGGYLIWRRIPVFIDGRADVYGDDFLFYYHETTRLEDDWAKPLEEHRVEYVLIEPAGRLATLLRVSGDWTEAYADHTASVFLRVPRSQG